jgi:pimeloyl-ACP methyl ester carboxylesterase
VDSAALLDAINISKSDILGYSRGGMIAQQLTLNYPNKVDDLIIYSSNCGTNRSILPNPEISKQVTDLSGSAEDIKKRLIPLLFTQNWIKQNPDYMKKICCII